jgi:hypothetical protein
LLEQADHQIRKEVGSTAKEEYRLHRIQMDQASLKGWKNEGGSVHSQTLQALQASFWSEKRN